MDSKSTPVVIVNGFNYHVDAPSVDVSHFHAVGFARIPGVAQSSVEINMEQTSNVETRTMGLLHDSRACGGPFGSVAGLRIPRTRLPRVA